MNMEHYLNMTLEGHKGKVCPICGRIKAVLVKYENKLICDSCIKRIKKKD